MHLNHPTLPCRRHHCPPSTALTLPPPSQSALPYLPHLDGLRALAFLPIFLFHLSPSLSRGGFLGVDVFLTLSGFLITRNLLVTTSIPLPSFYYRRFWRLYPASLITTTLTALTAFLVFPPDLSVASARAALAALALSANLHFHHIADYFDGAPHLKPLLHLWSLALEEHFYLFWPFLLRLLHHPRHSALLPAALTLAAASLATATALHPSHLAFVFYLLPCRLHHFAAGVALALTENRWASSKPLAALPFLRRASVEAFAAAALTITVASFALAPPHISPLQTFPLIAAVCVLVVTPQSAVETLVLSNHLARALGRMSYSAYLVHWPIIVFTRCVRMGLRLPPPSSVLLTAATLLCTVALSRGVERPMRKGGRPYFVPVLVTLFATILFCAIGVWTDGWAFRMSGSPVPISGQTVAINYRELCKEPEDVPRRPFLNNYSDGCVVGKEGGEHSKIIVIGDSFARHLVPSFDKLGKQLGVQYRFNFLTNCTMMAKNDSFRFQKSEVCRNFHDKRWKLIDGMPVSGVVPLPPNSTFVVAGFGEYASFEARRKRLKTLDADFRAAGHRMFVAGEPPGVSGSEFWRFSCLDIERSPLFQTMKSVSNSSSCVDPWLKAKWAAKKNAEEYERIFGTDLPVGRYINLYRSLCKEDDAGLVVCKRLVERDDLSDLGYVRDGLHLTIAGSEFLSDIFKRYLGS